MNTTPSPGSVGGVVGTARRILLSTSTQNASWVLLGSLSARAFGVLSFILLSRVLGPEEYGLFALAVAVMTMATDLSDLGMNSSAIRYGSEYTASGDLERFRILCSVVVRSRLFLGTLIFVVGVLASRPLSQFVLRQPGLENYLYLAFAGVFGALLNSAFVAIHHAGQRFKFGAAVYFSYGAVTFLGVALLALLDQLATVSALSVYVLAPLVGAAVGYALLPRGLIQLRLWSKEESQRILKFGKWIAIWSIATVVADRLSLFMLSSMTTTADVGLYNAALRIAALVELFPAAYASTLRPKFSGLVNNQRLWPEFRNASIVSMVIAAAIMIPSFFTHEIVTLLSGDAYSGAVPVLRMLLWMVAASALTSPSSAMIFAAERSHFFGLAAALKLILTFVLNTWLLRLYGPVGAAITAVTIQIVTFTLYAVGVAFLRLKSQTGRVLSV